MAEAERFCAAACGAAATPEYRGAVALIAICRHTLPDLSRGSPPLRATWGASMILRMAVAVFLAAFWIASAAGAPADGEGRMVGAISFAGDENAFFFDELDLAPGGNDGGADPASRFLSSVPDEIEPYFDLYLYVSKAERGPIAQHMFGYRREADGRLMLIHDWLVSTGRERREKYFTTTPVGLFKLDPERFYEDYWSRTWDAAMPWAMFLDYTLPAGRRTGIAIHAVTGDGKVSRLGFRDSGGCIRLSVDAARELFQDIQANYRGQVPVFATDAVNGGTSRTGDVVRLSDGTILTRTGYRVLLMIEDYGGSYGPPIVASSAP